MSTEESVIDWRIAHVSPNQNAGIRALERLVSSGLIRIEEEVSRKLPGARLHLLTENGGYPDSAIN